MKKINKKDIIIFICILVFSLIIFKNFITMHYATDTYNIIDRGYKEYAINYFLNDGRPFSCAFLLICYCLNINIIYAIIFSIIMALVISCISVMLLKNNIEKYKKPNNWFEELLIIVFSYFTIYNFYYLENMLYAECFVMALGIMFYIISSNYLIEKNTKYYFIKGCIFAVLGVLCYQGTIGFLVLITLVFSLIKNKNKIKSVFADVMLSGMFCIIGLIIDLLFIKFFGLILNLSQTRIGSLSIIKEKIFYILKNIGLIVKYNSNLYIPYLFLNIIIIVFFVMILYYSKTKHIEGITKNLFIILGAIILCFPLDIISYSDIFAGRTKFCMGSLIGLIFIFIYCDTGVFEKDNLLKCFFISIFLVYSFFIIKFYIKLMVGHKIVEERTKVECNAIDEYISEYEKNNNIVIKNISFCIDSKPTYYYYDIGNCSGLCSRPLSLEWSNNEALNYYTNRKLKEEEMPKELYEMYFKDKNWDALCVQEQIMFVNDTVIYCIY